jgi:phosphatidylglycerol:prolipoprotein diacylglycerol transferase
MLPVLFNIVLQPSWAPFAVAAFALAVGAWQFRSAKVAGEATGKGLQAAAIWAVGTFTAAFLAIAKLDNQNLFAMNRPVAVPLHTYGLLIATAFIVGLYLAGRGAQRAGLDKDRVGDLVFWILIAGMVGSRLLFIVVNWDDYAKDPVSVFYFWKGGLVFYGGFIGAAVVSYFYMKKHGMPFFAYADVLVPCVSLGHAIGRLGCFAAGCCWGGACDTHFALAARFPPEALAYQSQLTQHLINAGSATTVPVHPTQLYESLGELCIFVILMFWRTRKRFNGELLALYLVLYAPLRSLVETFRGDEERGRVFNFLGPWARNAWWNLSTSELISVGMFAFGVALFLWLRKRSLTTAPPSVPPTPQAA